MRLQKRQKERLLELISEGLQTDEINARAAKFKPAFKVSRQQVDFYRESRGVKLEEIEKASEVSALKRGFALKEKRVEALNSLAEKMHEELAAGGKLWLSDMKCVGTGDFQTIVDFETFNAGEVQQFRGVLDDIAKEVGDRRQKIDMKVNPRETLADMLGVPVEELPVINSDGPAN